MSAGDRVRRLVGSPPQAPQGVRYVAHVELENGDYITLRPRRTWLAAWRSPEPLRGTTHAFWVETVRWSR